MAFYRVLTDVNSAPGREYPGSLVQEVVDAMGQPGVPSISKGDQLETVNEPQPGLVALEIRKIGVAGSEVGNLESPGK